jgi:hypothetical protein
MGKIDKVKETLNTLRVAMSLLFGLFVVVISNVISRYERAETTLLFWVGVFFIYHDTTNYCGNYYKNCWQNA